MKLHDDERASMYEGKEKRSRYHSMVGSGVGSGFKWETNGQPESNGLYLLFVTFVSENAAGDK